MVGRIVVTADGQQYRRGTFRCWVPVTSRRWAVGGPHVAHVIELPAHREFESSVPRWARWIIDPEDPRFMLAARVHDYLLEEGYGRTQAAAEWLDGARALGAPDLLARLAYVAVAAWAVRRP